MDINIQYRKLTSFTFMLLSVMLLLTVACDDDGEGWNDSRYLENFELNWDNPNPKTGLPYTEEELAALKYDPTKEERFKGDQDVVLNLLLSKQISNVDIIDGTTGEVLENYSSAEKDGEMYSLNIVTSLESLGIVEGTSKIFKFDITYQDKSIGSVQFKVISLIALPPASEILKGQWKFNNASYLTQATIGNDLVLDGGMVHEAIDGISGADGAVLIDKDSWYVVNHGLPAASGEMVNEYTLIYDINIPASSYDPWLPFLQTSLDNSRDGAVYHNAGWFWTNGYGWSDWAIEEADTWCRVLITVGDGDCRIYVDNVKVYSNSPGADGVFALDLAGFLLFADNNGEDAPLRVSEIMLCDVTFKHEWAVEDVPPVGEPLK